MRWSCEQGLGFASRHAPQQVSPLPAGCWYVLWMALPVVSTYLYIHGRYRCQMSERGGRVAAAGSSAAAGCERPRRSTHSPAGTSTRLGERRHASVSVGAVGPPASGAQRKPAASSLGRVLRSSRSCDAPPPSPPPPPPLPLPAPPHLERSCSCCCCCCCCCCYHCRSHCYCCYHYHYYCALNVCVSE